MKQNLDDWLKSLKYLPDFMRDWHHAKDLFKDIENRANHSIPAPYKIDFKQAQVYVIDVFLWYMAKRGYTLQKSRKKLDFLDIDA